MSAPWLLARCATEAAAVRLCYVLLNHGIDPVRHGTEVYGESVDDHIRGRRIVTLVLPDALPTRTITPESEVAS